MINFGWKWRYQRRSFTFGHCMYVECACLRLLLLPRAKLEAVASGSFLYRRKKRQKPAAAVFAEKGRLERLLEESISTVRPASFCMGSQKRKLWFVCLPGGYHFLPGELLPDEVLKPGHWRNARRRCMLICRWYSNGGGKS